EWYNHQISSALITSAKNNNSISVSLEKDSNTPWDVPGSIFIETSSSVLSVNDESGSSYPLLQENTKILQNGWRKIESGLIITISPGDDIQIEFDNNSSLLISPLQTFNDLHHGVTIVGHHVTNLHEWASDFYDSPLLFTWLIERPSALEMDWRLPIIALGVLIATPLTINWLVKRDQNLRI
ncbi:hypothetical protein OAV53_01195, partial [Euryarchaeota archaeon]|nr:hypothetical protein [Euryarchaeota archaeon]